MSVNPDDPNGQPEHSYQVTHYIRPPGQFGSWQSIASAEHTAEDAIAWIRAHVAGSRDTAVGQPLPAAEQPEATTPDEPPADVDQAASVAPDAAEPDQEPAS